MANVFGVPYKVFVCFLGIVIVVLSVTGIYIWLKKRRAAEIKRNRIFSVANHSGQDN